MGTALPKEQYKQIWTCVNANKLLNKAPANVGININDAASEPQTQEKQPWPPPLPPPYLHSGSTCSVRNMFTDPDCAAAPLDGGGCDGRRAAVTQQMFDLSGKHRLELLNTQNKQIYSWIHFTFSPTDNFYFPPLLVYSHNERKRRRRRFLSQVRKF